MPEILSPRTLSLQGEEVFPAVLRAANCPSIPSQKEREDGTIIGAAKEKKKRNGGVRAKKLLAPRGDDFPQIKKRQPGQKKIRAKRWLNLNGKQAAQK